MQGFTPQTRIVEERNPDRKINGLIQGQFILDGETIFLQTRNGDRFNLDRVGISSTAFNNKDGILRYPKPFIYDDSGNIEQQGDIVIIAFEKGDIYNPVVIGSVIPLSKNDFFHDFEKTTYQKKKARFETEQCIIEFQDDGMGEIQIDVTAQEGEEETGTGNITLNLTGFDEENDGNITINISGDATLTANRNIDLQATEDVTIKASKNITVEGAEEVTVKGDEKVIVDSPLIEVGKDSTEKIVLGTSWAALFKAHTHPTPSGPSGTPVNAAQADSCLSDQNTTL